MQYDAFISYSHAADGRLAPAIQSGLQRFAKPWYRRRALRIFRDQTSLAATPELWPTIVRALESSRYFLLLASPEAAASRWVQREVGWWLEHRTPQTLLIVLTGGEVDWDDAAGDFDWSRTDAVPDGLRGAFAAGPLWVDLRWARAESQLSLKHARFQGAIADLAAPLRGQPKEELQGEEVAQQNGPFDWRAELSWRYCYCCFWQARQRCWLTNSGERPRLAVRRRDPEPHCNWAPACRAGAN